MWDMHLVVKRTCTSKLSIMVGTQQKGRLEDRLREQQYGFRF